MIRVLLFATLLALAGCDAPPPRPGTAQETSAGAQARAAAAGSATDQAGRESAAAAGAASAAEELAARTRAKSAIEAAVAARVRAVETAAVYDALRRQEAPLQAEAARAAQLAHDERQADDAATAYLSWVRLCRIIGLVGIVAGCLVGGAIAWLGKSPRLGAGVGALLAATGAVVIAMGPASAWLPWLLIPAGVIGLTVWAWTHRREIARGGTYRTAALAGCRVIDAIELDVRRKADEAKAGLRQALTIAGLADHVEASRGPCRDWTTPNPKG